MGDLTIFVPRGYEDEPRPWVCVSCGSTFLRSDLAGFQQHVGPCARAHLDEIQAERADYLARTAVMRPWDPEVTEHMRKVGERMKREGRLEVKPSERAGFS